MPRKAQAATEESVQDLVSTFNRQVVQQGLKQIFELLDGSNAGYTPSLSVEYGDTKIEVFKSMGQRFYITLEDQARHAGIKFMGAWPERYVDTVAECDGSEKNIRAMVGEVIANFRPVDIKPS